MENLFLRRASEQLREPVAFLGIVSPEPVRFYLKPKVAVLYDRPVLLEGTPGSGKTTLARLFDYEIIHTLLENDAIPNRKQLLAILTECGAIADGQIAILGARVSLESDYREIWDFDYPLEVRHALTTALIASRAVQLWIRSLERCGIPLGSCRIVPKVGAEGKLSSIGGSHCADALTRAREVERSIYEIIGSLVQPSIQDLPEECTSAYHPLDVIEQIAILTEDGEARRLQPLVILDDANVLHPDQFDAIKRMLARREMRVARWMMYRLDALNIASVLSRDELTDAASPPLPGINSARNWTLIRFQNAQERAKSRREFRKIASDMANRYLGRMPLFSRRRLLNFRSLMQTRIDPVAAGKLSKYRKGVENFARKEVSPQTVDRLLSIVDDYLQGKSDEGDEAVRWAMFSILVRRYINRVPQRDLFQPDVELSRPVKADSEVLGGARLHLCHQLDRPFFAGLDDLCDAASENAEQFLHLAAVLVDASATNITRGKPSPVSAAKQHRLLVDRASQFFDEWSFPHSNAVRWLISGIARRCVDVSLEPNASLGHGASAFGVIEAEFRAVEESHPQLATVLKYAVAYNAVSTYTTSCQGEDWMLVQLGGVPLLKYKLTLKRGGFIKSNLDELERFIQEGGL